MHQIRPTSHDDALEPRGRWLAIAPLLAAFAAVALLLGGCSSDDGGGDDSDADASSASADEAGDDQSDDDQSGDDSGSDDEGQFEVFDEAAYDELVSALVEQQGFDEETAGCVADEVAVQLGDAELTQDLFDAAVEQAAMNCLAEGSIDESFTEDIINNYPE